MRAVSWLLLATLGCGRLGIDPRADAVSADGTTLADAPPVACGMEGATCDDRNICTSTATCSAGICVGQGGPCEVANFDTEFSFEQGAQGWYYGYWNASVDPDGTYTADDFAPMAMLAEAWRPPDWEPEGSPNFSWCYILRWGGHPGSTPAKLPIRRWVSDVSGYATVVLHLAKADTGFGDGTSARLYVEGVLAFERAIAFDDGVGFEVLVPIEVDIGTRVDVMMHYNGDADGDTSDLNLRIESR